MKEKKQEELKRTDNKILSAQMRLLQSKKSLNIKGNRVNSLESSRKYL